MADQDSNTILYIETGMGFGGSAISLKQIVDNLKSYNSFVVFYAEKNQYFTSHFAETPNKFLDLKFTYKQKEALKNTINKITGIKLIEDLVLKSFSYISFFFDQLTIYHLSKIIRKENIAIVHINNGFDPIAIRAAKRCAVPCIVHSRGHGYRTLKQSDINYISKLIAPTKKIADHEHLKRNVPQSKICIIHNTIDLKVFAENTKRDVIREKHGIKQESIVIGMFARIIPMKGQLILIKAIEELNKNGLTVVCLFVGDASDYGDIYINELKAYIKDNCRETDFIFTGYQHDTTSYYSAVDFVVHPSIDEEAFGRIIIEAWASERPIVASDIGASIELIAHGKTGLIVEKNNPEQLAKALKMLITDREFALKLAKAGAQHSIKFGNGPLIEAIETIYDQTLSAKTYG